MPYAEWSRIKHASELQLNFETEINTFHDETPLPLLVDKAQNYAGRMVKSEAETMKFACCLGKAVHCLRSKGFQKWDSVVDTIGHGLSKKTLENYQQLYKFLHRYPRFLRVKISYTALLRYSKKIAAKFDDNADLRATWSSLRR